MDVPDEPLDFADRWMRDSLDVLRPPFSASQITVEMTHALGRLEAFRTQGVQATATHLVVHAAARALARNPGLHQVMAGNRRQRPSRVDIGLSVSGDSFVAPVLVLEGADTKSVAALAEETARRAPEVREAQRRELAALRRWGRLVPFAWLRRALIRRHFSSASRRRALAGTFQVSAVATDWALTSAFVASGVLIAGPVWPRVMAVDGAPAVRPAMYLTLCCDHGMWDGRAAARFLAAVKMELERSSDADDARSDPELRAGTLLAGRIARQPA